MRDLSEWGNFILVLSFTRTVVVYLSFIGIFCTCLLHLYPPYLHNLKRKVERYLHSQYGHVGVMSSIFIAVVNNIVSKLSFDGEVDTWTWRRTAMGRLT